MKKVINITLGGLVFACESDAYDELAIYLDSIKARYNKNEDYKEIVEDIEIALAEKFVKSKRSEKKAITLSGVERVISELGSVSDFDDEAVQEETISESNNEEEGKDDRKRLYRNTDDALLGGVASGIAAYFDCDPVIVRALFFASVFVGGFGIILYLLLWVIMPKAETTEQKYAMHGKKVTLSEITENMKQKIEDIDSEKIKKGAEEVTLGLKPILNKIFKITSLIIQYLFIFIRFTLGVILIVIGAGSIAFVVVTIVGVITGASVNLFDYDTNMFIAKFVPITIESFIFLISTAFVVVVPILFLIIGGAGLVDGENKFTLWNTISLFVIWFMAVAFVVMIGTSYVLDMELFENDGEVSIILKEVDIVASSTEIISLD